MRRGATSARPWRTVAAALCLAAAAASDGAPAASRPLRVRASEAFAACLAPALEAFTRETGLRAVLEVGDPDPADGVDVVVGEDAELTRLLESGRADPRAAVDLGTIPWVYVSPEGSGADLAQSIARADRFVVLGGRLGRAAREALGSRVPPERLRATRDAAELRGAAFALVPRSLAGAGEQRLAPVRPLTVVTVVVGGSTEPLAARALVGWLGSARGRAALSPSVEAPAASADVRATATTAYVASVVDWWLPQCSIDHNRYNDPSRVLGPPDAAFLGVKDQYTGMMSLGMGGYVTVDMGVSAIDGDGADVRVYQTTSSEPVTLYGAASSQGPFALLGLRVPCGERTGGGIFSAHCDFDLRGTGLAEARYLKIEDGEIYPCLLGGTITEGADIDAVQVLNARP